MIRIVIVLAVLSCTVLSIMIWDPGKGPDSKMEGQVKAADMRLRRFVIVREGNGREYKVTNEMPLAVGMNVIVFYRDSGWLTQKRNRDVEVIEIDGVMERPN